MRLSAFPERVAPRILSLESVDFFGTSEHFSTLGTKGLSRARQEFSVLVEGLHIFGRRPKPRVAKPKT